MLKKLGEWTGKEGSFRRNSLIMSGGAVVNVVVALGLSPIVSRLYTKEEFGVYYIFLSVVTIGTLMVNGMYNHAFVVPKKERDFLALLKFCVWSSVVLSVLFTVFLYVLGDYFLVWINADQLGNYMYLIPVGIFISSLLTSLQNWNVRRKEFKTNSISSIVSGTTDRGSQILLALSLAATFPSLIFSKLLSDTATFVSLAKRSMISSIREAMEIPNERVQSVVREYIKYPKYVLTGNFVNRFSGDIPLFLLSSSFGLKSAGAFGFAIAMLNVPYKVIGGSISTVYFQKATELYHKDRRLLQAFSQSSFIKMTVLGSLAFGFVFAFGDIAFKIVFGDEWNLAGRIARVLSIYYVFKIVSSPFSTVIRSVKKEEYGIYINIVLALSRIVGIYLGLMTQDLMYAIVSFTMGNIAGYVFSSYMIFKAQGLPFFMITLYSCFLIFLIFSLFYIIRYFTMPFLYTLL